MTSNVSSTPPTKRSPSHLDEDMMADAETFARHVYGEGRKSDEKQGPTPVDPDDIIALLTQNPLPASAPPKMKAKRKSLLSFFRRQPKIDTGKQRPGLLSIIARWLNLR